MHAHGQGHAHGERLSGDRKALAAALGLIVAFMVVEVVAGVLADSLALLADAAHLLTDAAALAFALGAATLAARPAVGRWTFGLGRVEILAAQANGITLVLAAVWIAYAAVSRLVSPPEVRGGVVLVVALVGIAVNLAAVAMLRRASRESLNVRGAFLHVVTDLAAFIATAVAGAFILVTGWDRADPIVSLGVAALMVWAAVGLLRESTRIFLEGSPGEIDPGEVGRAIASTPSVVEVHDLHVWTVTSGFPALSAHVLVAPDADCHGIRRDLERTLATRFGVTHTTLQVDHAETGPQAVELGTAARRSGPI